MYSTDATHTLSSNLIYLFEILDVTHALYLSASLLSLCFLVSFSVSLNSHKFFKVFC